MKKFTKKIVSLVLVLTMVLSFSIVGLSAFAAPSKPAAQTASIIKKVPKIVLKKDASVVYNADTNAMNEALFNAMLDKENSDLPADVAYTDFTYTMVIRDVGEGRLVTFNYKGNDDYYVGVATGSVTVTKASMKVKVPFFKSIYCDEDLPADYVTVTPADKKIDVYTVFAGINSSANIGLYVNLPTSVTNVLYNDTVGKIWAALDKDGYTLKERLAEGMTVADFKKVLNNEAILKALELAGVDTTAFEALLAILNNNVIAGLTDGSRIAIGTPNRAGSYAVIAIGSNKNYETAQGYGTLLVRKRWGATLQWKNGDPTQGAEVLYNGKVGHVQDGIKVIYSGFTSDNKPYVSSKVPTEPGKYLANAFLLGGNYVALPIFQSFTIS